MFKEQKYIHTVEVLLWDTSIKRTVLLVPSGKTLM